MGHHAAILSAYRAHTQAPAAFHKHFVIEPPIWIEGDPPDAAAPYSAVRMPTGRLIVKINRTVDNQSYIGATIPRLDFLNMRSAFARERIRLNRRARMNAEK
jgi:hypothetical protein